MAPKMPQKTTITDVAPSIEDENNQKIVNKTPSIDNDDEKMNSPSREDKSILQKESEYLLVDSKSPSFSSDFSLDSKASTTTNLIQIKIKIQNKSKKYIRRMKCCLKCQIKASSDRRIADIIVAVNAKVHNKPQQSASTKTEYRKHKRDLDDQEKLPGGLFESAKQLKIFKHNFKIAAYSRASWKSLTTIPMANNTKDLLTDFMQFTEDNLKTSKSNCNQEQVQAATNMYISLWKSLAHPIKTAMKVHADSHDTDSPALLYHLLWQYTGTANNIIHDQQLHLNNLPNKLGDFKFDVDKFCNYAAEMLKTLCDAGGNNKQAALKLYEAL
eukprot:6431816-Ditylum_brightwellii.AAC.1